jgi:hypothetical protein
VLEGSNKRDGKKKRQGSFSKRDSKHSDSDEPTQSSGGDAMSSDNDSDDNGLDTSLEVKSGESGQTGEATELPGSK